jgi:hypothetical protein
VTQRCRYARFGKENVERMTEDLFKHDTDGDRNISYEEYLEIVNTSDMLTAPSAEGAAAPLAEKKKPLKAGECGRWSVLLSNLPSSPPSPTVSMPTPRSLKSQ